MSNGILGWQSIAHGGTILFRPMTDEEFGFLKLENNKILRDQFAISALNGLLSNSALKSVIEKKGDCDSGWIESSAWAFADEMMKARK